MNDRLLGSVLLVTGLALVGWSVTIIVERKRERKRQGWHPSLRRSLYIAACGAVGETLAAVFPGVLRATLDRDEKLLELAGMTPEYQRPDLLGMRVLFVFFFLAVSLLPAHGFSGLWGSLAVAAGVFLPGTIIADVKKKYQRQLNRDFPAVLDMLVVTVGSGMAVGQALKEVRQYSPSGAVSDELARIDHEQRLNQPLGAILRRCANRIEGIELKAVIISLVQAIDQGGQIVETLRLQAEQLRYNRLMKAEEAAQKLPVKLTFPMLFIITPCVLLIIFAPLFLSVAKSFKAFDF